MAKWGSKIEVETRNRIKLSIAAYAYEFENDSIISDHEFDQLALKIDLKVRTRDTGMDKFFIKNFTPDTGMWVRNHPNLIRIKQLYEKWYVKSTTINEIARKTVTHLTPMWSLSKCHDIEGLLAWDKSIHEQLGIKNG